MSKSDELNQAYAGWRTRYFADRQTAQGFPGRFAEAFRTYIGAPESFQPPSNTPMVQRYVWACKAEFDHLNQRIQAHAFDDDYDLVQWDQHLGFWYFALAVRCEIAPNTWPKEWFPVLIMFNFEGKRCELSVTTRDDGRFDVDFEDQTTWQHSFDFIVSLLLEQFTGPRREAQKQPMGFVMPAAPQPS